MQTNIFHSLLSNSTENGLLQNLNLSQHDEKELTRARDEIKQALSQGFLDARSNARRQKLDYEVPSPRFAMQGSYVYRTLNAPAHPPGQQVDIDLGVYLPFRALGNGEKPRYATQFYFETVIRILESHIESKRKGQWILIADKDTCVRVQISDRTHIDLPLYATPESVFNQVKDALSQSLALNESENRLFKSMNSFDQEATLLERVSPTEIHLAHREKGWVPSNALVIRDWVKFSCASKGANNQVRGVCRYLKAWRDEKWQDGSGAPSSILLLAFVIRVYEHSSNHHCELLKDVIIQLPNAFNLPILVPCPTPEDSLAKEDLRNRLGSGEKKAFIESFNELKNAYLTAKSCESKTHSNKILVNIFGERLPFSPEKIKQDVNVEPTKVAAVVKTAKRRVEPLRTTEASTSG